MSILNEEADLTNSRVITHIHYKGWEDCSVPETSEQIKAFEKMVNVLLEFYEPQLDSLQSRALIHCRQGHGRTGSLLTILAMRLQEKLWERGMLDCPMTIPDTFVCLRKQRSYLVEVREQWCFIHSFLGIE